MIDKKWIGHELEPAEIALERGRLRFFAKAIGETDPVYTDRSKITDIYDKKGGKLEFVIKTSEARNARNELVAELRTSLVVRN